MKLIMLGLISVLCCLAGCASGNRVRLIDPPTPGLLYRLGHLHEKHLPRTKSLKPIFRWEDQGVGVKYDIAIWDAVPDMRRVNRAHDQGNRIYLRKGLTKPKHQVEITLLPLKRYLWSVKLSTNSEWSKYNYRTLGWRYYNRMSPFETPVGE